MSPLFDLSYRQAHTLFALKIAIIVSFVHGKLIRVWKAALANK